MQSTKKTSPFFPVLCSSRCVFDLQEAKWKQVKGEKLVMKSRRAVTYIDCLQKTSFSFHHQRELMDVPPNLTCK